MLGRVLFPVGEMAKPEVKALAATIGLQSIAEQKESMGICFIGKRKFGPFLESYTEQRPPGKVMLLDGAGRVILARALIPTAWLCAAPGCSALEIHPGWDE